MQQAMLKAISRSLVALLIALSSNLSLAAGKDNDLIADIDKAASLSNKAPEALLESIRNRIGDDASSVVQALVPKLSDAEANETQLAFYVWALGLAKDPKAVDSLIALSKQTKSELVKGNCLRALATIGGQESGAFLLATLGKTTDTEMRFNILNLLSQMQYDPALPKTEEILKLDPEQFYWQSIFVFGKMGDKAEPFLLKKMSDKDRNVRANAMNVLGQWLICPESAKAFREQFWKETDVELRGLILSSLEKVTPDLDSIKKFFEEVASKEKEEALVQFSKETLDNLKTMKEQINSFKTEKAFSQEQFKKEYDELYQSAGKEGDYKILSTASSFQDELKLKKLRERILQRDSDESFYDYQKVNEIIMFNRFLDEAAQQQVQQKN